MSLFKKCEAKSLLSDDEKARIEAAVCAAEATTSGEIVPLIVDDAYTYPEAEIVAAGGFALALGVLLSWAFGGESLWIFLAIFLLSYLPLRLLIRALPPLKRTLIPPSVMAAEVEERALVAFVEHGIYRTRDATGILILISLFERRVYILADHGINAVVPPQSWDEIVAIIRDGLKRNETADALCTAIGRCGELLAADFPRRDDDRDELPNLIS
mgnify:CR=1 FL=1